MGRRRKKKDDKAILLLLLVIAAGVYLAAGGHGFGGPGDGLTGEPGGGPGVSPEECCCDDEFDWIIQLPGGECRCIRCDDAYDSLVIEEDGSICCRDKDCDTEHDDGEGDCELVGDPASDYWYCSGGCDDADESCSWYDTGGANYDCKCDTTCRYITVGVNDDPYETCERGGCGELGYYCMPDYKGGCYCTSWQVL